MRTINPADVPAPNFYKLMTATIGPRPIAFAGTVDAAGRPNLSPFSFFNVFGSNPPTLIFSTAVTRHGTQKHTLQNLRDVGEVTINVVSYSMVEQMSLASAEFDKGVNEFEKAGFTERPSEAIRPPGVAEAPATFECRVKQIIETGTEPGAGNVIICEVVRGHFRDDMFDSKGVIVPQRVDLVGRLGGDWYCRANGDALFELARPKVGVGIDQLPEAIRTSTILTGNDLGKLGSFTALPTPDAVRQYRQSGVLNDTFDEAQYGCQYLPDLLHLRAKKLLAANKVEEAWLTLLQL